MDKKFKKGDRVLYDYGVPGYKVQAKVLTSHWDGRVTVESQHVLDPQGEVSGCYLGYIYRWLPTDKMVLA